MKKEIMVKSAGVYEARALAEMVGIANNYSSRITIVMGNRSINAKSIMGIFSLDLSKDLELHVHSDDCADFLDEIKDFIVK